MSELLPTLLSCLKDRPDRDLTLWYRPDKQVLTLLPAEIDISIPDGLDRSGMEALGLELVGARELADRPFNLFLKTAAGKYRPFGSNAPAFYRASKDGTVLLRGPGWVDDRRVEVVTWVLEDGLRVHAKEESEALARMVPAEIVFHGSQGKTLFVASGQTTAVLSVERECELSTGRWRSPRPGLPDLISDLGDLSVDPADPTALADTAMDAFRNVLLALDAAPWPAIQALAGQDRHAAIESLVSDWPQDDSHAGQVEYARLYFLLEAGREDEVIEFLESATLAEHPYLYRHNNRLIDEPNLFERVGMYKSASLGHRRTLADPEFNEHVNYYGHGLVASDLAVCLLKAHETQAAWDALAWARALDSTTIESLAQHARFHAVRGDPEACLRYFRWAAIRAGAPKGKPCSLLDMAQARTTEKDVIGWLDRPEFGDLRKHPGFDDQVVLEAERAAYRRFQQMLDQALELGSAADTWLKDQQYPRAAEAFANAMSVLPGAPEPAAIGLLPMLAAGRAEALLQSGSPAEAETVLARIAGLAKGLPPVFSEVYSRVLGLTGNPESADSWLCRANALGKP